MGHGILTLLDDCRRAISRSFKKDKSPVPSKNVPFMEPNCAAASIMTIIEPMHNMSKSYMCCVTSLVVTSSGPNCASGANIVTIFSQ